MTPNSQLGVLSYENDDIELLSTFEKQGYRTEPILYVNGKRIERKLIKQARSNQTLLSFLRDILHLTGSKLGCAEGGCGACTVMISKIDNNSTNQLRHYSVNACLMPVLAADGCHVTTVEGIGTVKQDKLHPVQTSMVDMHGSQCGFCTPGIIVSIYTLLTNNPKVDYLEEHLDGNLCRCTGYRPIWDAARALCDDGEDKVVRGPCGTPCSECPERETCQQECNIQDKRKNEDDICCSTSTDKMKQYKETFLANKSSWQKQADNMFPKELLDSTSEVYSEIEKPLMVVDKTEFHAGGTWFKPTSLIDMLKLLKEFENTNAPCKIVIGNTEVGIETRFKHAVYPRLMSPATSIHEIFDFQITNTTLLTIGSCCPLSTIQYKCTEEASANDRLVRSLMPIHDMLRWFASSQIRNVACLGGNLATASPISDMNPMLAAMGAKLILASYDNGEIVRRSVNVSEFFLKYRTVDLKASEFIEKIEVPILRERFEYLKPFKQARRREDDISIVTSGMRIVLTIKDGKYIIEDICIAFGGMATTTILAKETMKVLIGAEFCRSTIDEATEILIKEMSLPETVPGGQAAYRMTLTASFLYKFYLSVVEELKKDVEEINNNSTKYPDIGDLPPIPVIDESEESGTCNFLSEKKPKYFGTQTYPAPKVASGLEDKEIPLTTAAKDADEKTNAVVVGKAATHASGPLHCTGEAIYTDDIPLPPGTLHAALLLSEECGGKFESIDVTDATKIPGVVGIFTAQDLETLGGKNIMGPIVHDEVVFLPLGEVVRTVGQVLGVVVAESLESAEHGARTVNVQYGKPESKIIVTVDDAIEAGSFYEFSRHKYERGDRSVLSSLKETADFVGEPEVGDVVKVSGSFRSGAQEHFYLETNSTLVVPSESDTNLTVYASTQAPTKTQTYCASATGTPASKVVVRMKRMGGGFGGKETRSVFASCAAAVAAKLTTRPVRLTLSREVDMKITGTRHVFVSTYEASAQITENGAKLLAYDVKIYSNAGCAFDLSGPVVDRALFHIDGVYNFPNMRAEGVACKTVQPPHTAFRGFGGPQGMAVAEHVMDHLALACQVSGDDLRRSNMYKDGDHIPFGMVIGEQYSGKWNIPTMWDRLFTELGVTEQRKRIEQFNSENKWRKRGLSFLPTKFGIAFTAKYMNQGGALVHVYTDGTVLVSHGGTEMGQGLHTKVCQVAAQAFGIPLEDVYVNDSSTDKVANTIPTAASMSTDMYGMATLDAARQIIARLEPIREKLGPKASFKEIVSTAHMERIDLSAHGFFALDSSRCGYDWTKEKPDGFPSDAPENSWKGHPFNYFTQGIACTEVEVDILTGDHKTLRSDVLVDVGSSINPAIDIGQIEGAFIQGMGWSTIEEVVYACDDHTWVRPRGSMFTTGPGTYKIPAFNDVPEVFNVSLLDKVDNPFAVHSSKAIGEPPFFLGTSVFYAIKDAILAARKEKLGNSNYFEMRMPATSERIRMYCADALVQKAVSEMKKDSTVQTESFQPQGTY